MGPYITSIAQFYASTTCTPQLINGLHKAGDRRSRLNEDPPPLRWVFHSHGFSCGSMSKIERLTFDQAK